MKVVDIHPEELIDRLARGLLTPAERERLNAHLRQCSSCRFEMGVRADLTEDTPAFEERPQLTFLGSERRSGVAPTPRELPAPQVSLSVRPRARHRWPLALLAAAFVLCAGGAMAAVITGAVSDHWLPWAPEPKPVEPSAGVSDAKPVLKVKRAVARPGSALTPASEAIASSAVPARAAVVAPAPVAVDAPSAVVIANSSAPPTAVPRRAEAARALPENSRPSANGALVAATAASPADAAAPRVEPAAALFADANRARRDGNADRAVALYRALQSRYPSSSETELSRALLAQLLLERGNPEAALAGFDRYLADETPVLSAEALVGRARALEQLDKSTQAAAAWRQVQSRYPGSVHARLAATRLAALGMR